MKHVYLLESLAFPQRFYVRVTSDLDARLGKHNEGGSPHTAPFLVLSIRFENDARAGELERYLKSRVRSRFRGQGPPMIPRRAVKRTRCARPHLIQSGGPGALSRLCYDILEH